ncbi:MAG: NAD(P)H-dependent oxidoreductase [Propionibacterium sp.]|nr:NAD(P)H-dependent oxidoreductase [Propionibacterium sp.]
MKCPDRAGGRLVFVTPEYNYGYSAAIWNAIDHLYHEWRDKAVGFVSSGGAADGSRAVQQLKQVVTTLRMVPVAESVNIPLHTTFIHDGRVHANDGMNQATDATHDEPRRLDSAFRPLREDASSAAA